MTDQSRPIAKAINAWRFSWTVDRKKHELGPTEDEDWNDYVNSLSMSDVLWSLEMHDGD